MIIDYDSYVTSLTFDQKKQRAREAGRNTMAVLGNLLKPHIRPVKNKRPLPLTFKFDDYMPEDIWRNSRNTEAEKSELKLAFIEGINQSGALPKGFTCKLYEGDARFGFSKSQLRVVHSTP